MIPHSGEARGPMSRRRLRRARVDREAGESVKLPSVVFRTHDGYEQPVRVGGLIGRARTAELQIRDSRVSEAHAMVSLRGQQLVLLRLRGVLLSKDSDGEQDELVLKEGVRVYLFDEDVETPGNEPVYVDVVRVETPSSVLAISLGDEPPHVLVASVYSIVDPGRLVPWHIAEAHGWIFSTAESWMLHSHGAAPTPLRVGPGAPETPALRVGPYLLTPCERHLRELDAGKTIAAGGLSLRLRLDSATITRAGGAELTLPGLPARLLYELSAFDGPVAWEPVALEIWPERQRADPEAQQRGLRLLWDRTLSRLRGALRAYGIIRPLVTTDKLGNYQFVRDSRDRVVRED